MRVTGSKSESVTILADITKISGGTREITAVRNDNLVTVYCNFYGVNLAINNNATTSFELGTLPTGWEPKVAVYQRAGYINDLQLSNARMNINTSGVISVLFNVDISGSGKTFRTTLTYTL